MPQVVEKLYKKKMFNIKALVHLIQTMFMFPFIWVLSGILQYLLQNTRKYWL